MSRKPKNKMLLHEMCGRLKLLVEVHLSLGLNELTEYLGYSNTSVIRNMLDGKSFPDTERLLKLSRIRTPSGKNPNIHWLITGDGLPLIKTKGVKSNTYSRLSIVINKLSDDKAKSLLKVLT